MSKLVSTIVVSAVALSLYSFATLATPQKEASKATQAVLSDGQKLMLAYDKDQDGSLSPSEVADLERLSKHFTMIDENADGQLSSEEIDALKRKVEKVAKAHDEGAN